MAALFYFDTKPMNIQISCMLFKLEKFSNIRLIWIKEESRFIKTNKK